MNEPLVDPKSWDLAEHFLPANATESDKQSLAADIQTAVENWFEHQEWLAQRRKHFAEVREKLSSEADATDFKIMWYAQCHPGICGSNAATGEALMFGGRRQR